MNIEIPVCWICERMAAPLIERMPSGDREISYLCINRDCEKYERAIDPSWEKVEVKDEGKDELD